MTATRRAGGPQGARRVASIRLMPNRMKSLSLDAGLYKMRNLVERFFNKLKNFRAIAG